MLNFEGTGRRYRERIQYRAEDLFDRMIHDHLLKGGDFDAKKITKFFGTAVRTAQLMTDLEIGTGLNPCPEEEEEENDDENCETTPAQNGLQTFTPDKEGPATHSVPTCACQPHVVHDEVRDLGEGDTEGPPGCVGNAERVCDPDSGSDQADDNGPAGSGEVNPPEQQPVPAVTRPGTGRGHSGGPQGS